jgi:hypothetical protein
LHYPFEKLNKLLASALIRLQAVSVKNYFLACLPLRLSAQQNNFLPNGTGENVQERRAASCRFYFERRSIMQKWEYKVEKTGRQSSDLSEDQLNGLGADGWELVATTSSDYGNTFYFKRLKS